MPAFSVALVGSACQTNYHRPGGLNHRHLFSHNPGGWQSEIKVGAGLISPEISPWLADDCPLPGSSHGHFFVLPWVLDYSSCKKTSHIGLRTSHITHLKALSHFFKTPSLYTWSYSEVLDIRASTYGFWRDTVQLGTHALFPGLSEVSRLVV